ncbi:MAG: hypothetical protein F4Y73_16460 [Gemmatimonadetes bacterium]|nr:hypothetical protein [Gemmatimonadota bacterium]
MRCLTILLTAAACDTAPAPQHTIHADSAGIPIVTAVAPQWAPGEGWTVDPEPLVEIGAVTGAPEYQFSEVVAAVRLSNGDIVVADRGASELRSYDSAGIFQWRTGRFGEGPGEFESLGFVGTMVGDSLVSYDSSLMRAQVFDSRGRLVRTMRVSTPPGEATRLGSVSDKAVGIVSGLLIVRYIDLGETMETGIVRWPNERLVSIDLGTGETTSLLVVPGHEAVVEWREDGGYRHGRYTFSRMPEYGSAGDRLAVIDTEAYLVRIVSPVDGSIERIVRREMEPREATDAIFEAHLDGIIGMFDDLPAEGERQVRQAWRDTPRAPFLPVLRSVHVDAASNLWLAPYHIVGANPPAFEVHAPDGAWLGSVSVPPGLQRAFIQYQTPYMETGEDYILGVWADDLDVQYVRMYRINK